MQLEFYTEAFKPEDFEIGIHGCGLIVCKTVDVIKLKRVRVLLFEGYHVPTYEQLASMFSIIRDHPGCIVFTYGFERDVYEPPPNYGPTPDAIQ